MWIKILLTLFLITSTNAIETECKEDETHKKIFCYYLFDSNQSIFIAAESLPPCTHIIFAFAKLDIDGELKIAHDSNERLEEKVQREILTIKDLNSCVKILLAVGGKDEGGGKFSSLAETETKREKFAENLLKFLIFYGFDGVDLHWMYPTLRGGLPEDSQNFLSLIKTVKQKLSRRKKLVVAALGANSILIDSIYSNYLTDICQTLDFILLQTYDYNEKNLTSFSAPLRGFEESVAGNVEKFVDKKCEKKKIVVGISSYGKIYKMKTRDGKIGANAVMRGEIEYQKICKSLKEKSHLDFHRQNEIKSENIHWKKEKGSNNEKYAFHARTWVSYEDHETIADKAEFVNYHNLAGLMFFTLNADDPTGEFCGVHFPLVNTAEKNLQ